jgi:hypothetical protein
MRGLTSLDTHTVSLAMPKSQSPTSKQEIPVHLLEILILEAASSLQQLEERCEAALGRTSPRLDYLAGLIAAQLQLVEEGRYQLTHSHHYEKLHTLQLRLQKLLPNGTAAASQSRLLETKWQEVCRWVEDARAHETKLRQLEAQCQSILPAKSLEALHQGLETYLSELPHQISLLRKSLPTHCLEAGRLFPELAAYAKLQAIVQNSPQGRAAAFEELHAQISREPPSEHPFIRRILAAQSHTEELQKLHAQHVTCLQQTEAAYSSGDLDQAQLLMQTLGRRRFPDLDYEALRRRTSRLLKLRQHLHTTKIAQAAEAGRNILKKLPNLPPSSPLQIEAQSAITRHRRQKGIFRLTGITLVAAACIALGFMAKHKKATSEASPITVKSLFSPGR